MRKLRKLRKSGRVEHVSCGQELRVNLNEVLPAVLAVSDAVQLNEFRNCFVSVGCYPSAGRAETQDITGQDACDLVVSAVVDEPLVQLNHITALRRRRYVLEEALGLLDMPKNDTVSSLNMILGNHVYRAMCVDMEKRRKARDIVGGLASDISEKLEVTSSAQSFFDSIICFNPGRLCVGGEKKGDEIESSGFGIRAPPFLPKAP